MTPKKPEQWEKFKTILINNMLSWKSTKKITMKEWKKLEKEINAFLKSERQRCQKYLDADANIGVGNYASVKLKKNAKRF